MKRRNHPGGGVVTKFNAVVVVGVLVISSGLLIHGQRRSLQASPVLPAVERQTLHDALNSDFSGDVSGVLSDLKARNASGGGNLSGVAVSRSGPRRIDGDAGAAPGQFDYYTLALSWEPAFCEAKKDKPECRGMSADQFAAKNLVLHGLWPSKNGDSQHTYGFCGVDPSVQQLDNPAGWCKMPALNLSDETKSGMAKFMPGQQSCLENHEWYKHGTCSGMDSDTFFSKADSFVAEASNSNLGRFITANVGNIINKADLTAAFEQDFGPGSASSLGLSCAHANNQDMLLELHITLSNPLPAGGLKVMPTPVAGSGNGQCPPKFLIDPVHAAP